MKGNPFTQSVQSGVRRFVLTLCRALQLALLVEQAQYSLDNEGDGRARAAACCFAQSTINHILDNDFVNSAALANDHPLQLENIR